MSAAAVAETPVPKKSNKKLIIIIAAAVLLLSLGGGGAFMMLKKKPIDEDDEAADSHAAPAKTAKAGAPNAAVKHDPAHPPAYVPLDPFTVNLADREAERYAQVAVTLELADPKTADHIKNFMPAIRNNILMVLAHKSAADLLSLEGKVKLAGEVQRASSRALGVQIDEPRAEVDDEEAETTKSKKKKKKKAPDAVLPISAVHFSNLIVQ